VRALVPQKTRPGARGSRSGAEGGPYRRESNQRQDLIETTQKYPPLLIMKNANYSYMPSGSTGTDSGGLWICRLGEEAFLNFFFFVTI
jgi:hypothetical protein